jgi:hypothetical protein
MAVFTAGIVLLLNIWGGKRSGLSTDTNKEMADVHKCMQVLQACEQRWVIHLLFAHLSSYRQLAGGIRLVVYGRV